MSVPVESDIAPVARLLIYAILPDGEVVVDSAKYEVGNCLANKVGFFIIKFSTFKTKSCYYYQLCLHVNIGAKRVK